jgi:HAMP domain-containing protein/putative methionine-R-sulfoxide reductase with GAF domain
MKPIDRFRRTSLQLVLINMGSNICGALLTIFYFINVHDSSSGTRFEPDLGIAALMLVGMVVLGNRLVARYVAPLWAWYRRAVTGDEPDPAPLHIRQLALNLPATSAAITLGLWWLASLLFGALGTINPAAGRYDWASLGQAVLGTAGIAGPITTILVYFAMEQMWQSELPLFFTKDDPARTPAFRLPIRWRFLILFIMGAMPLLLLAILSYNYATQIASAEQPETMLPGLLRLELFLAGSGILIAVILARTLGAPLVEKLETLGRRLASVQAGNLDERMAVTSNDEMGALATYFNQMAEGLKRRDTELRTIYQISQDITASLELDQTLQAILEQVRPIIAYDGAEICLYDEAEDVLRVQAWARADAVLADTRERSYRLGEGYTGWVGQHRQSLLVSNADTYQDQQPVTRQVADGVQLNSYLGVPLVANQKMVGTLELVSTRQGAFDEHARQLLETVAPQAAIAIANAAQVLERERRLKEQIQQLRIEVDEAKKARQVAEITTTEYFQKLQAEAQRLRDEMRAPSQGQEEDTK